MPGRDLLHPGVGHDPLELCGDEGLHEAATPGTSTAQCLRAAIADPG